MTTVKTVPGTLKIQITTTSRGEMQYRDTSCTCSPGKEHTGHELKQVRFLKGNSDDQKKKHQKQETHEHESDDQKKKHQTKETHETEKTEKEKHTIDRECFI